MLNDVAGMLKLEETEYFGFRYIDAELQSVRCLVDHLLLLNAHIFAHVLLLSLWRVVFRHVLYIYLFLEMDRYEEKHTCSI